MGGRLGVSTPIDWGKRPRCFGFSLATIIRQRVLGDYVLLEDILSAYPAHQERDSLANKENEGWGKEVLWVSP